MPDETARWVDSMPAAYERFLAPTVFQPFAADLAARIAARAPQRILELAAGTGVLTRELLTVCPAAQITATDLNDAMVEIGRTRAPAATWRQADAMTLPYDDGTFDAIACQFGAMFFPARPAAYAEARRVLAPAGRLILNVWDTLDSHAFEVVVVDALKRAFPDDPPMFLAQTPHGYADRDAVVADLRAGGFATVHAETITVEGHAASAADLAVGYCTGTPLRPAIDERGDVATTIEIVAEELTKVFGAGPITGSMSAHVFEAARD